MKIIMSCNLGIGFKILFGTWVVQVMRLSSLILGFKSLRAPFMFNIQKHNTLTMYSNMLYFSHPETQDGDNGGPAEEAGW